MRRSRRSVRGRDGRDSGRSCRRPRRQGRFVHDGLIATGRGLGHRLRVRGSSGRLGDGYVRLGNGRGRGRCKRDRLGNRCIGPGSSALVVGRRGRDQHDGVCIRRRLVRENIEHDDCHVVDTAALQRQCAPAQLAALSTSASSSSTSAISCSSSSFVRPSLQRRRRLPGTEVELPAVGLDPGLDPERPRENVPVRVNSRFFGVSSPLRTISSTTL